MNKSTLESSLSRIAKALIKALDSTKTVIPVLETTCGHGTSIGGPLTHFRDLFAMIPKSYHDRLGVCLDTCHTFAAGYDLRTPKGWSAFMEEFDKLIGLKLLRALHLNDSKTPMGSKRDLHANIGTGFLGLRGFHNVMNDRRLEGLPMILETPIDRPAATVKKDNQASDSEAEEASDEETKPPAKGGKKKPAKSARAKPSKPAMVEDKSIWAREIKLLESLIGMDTESEEFLSLERQLADEGREERAKHQALFDKKKAKEGKEKGGKDRSLVDMFSAPATKETAS
jgi:AP endonuclease-1